MKKIFSFILAAFFSSITFSQTWTRPGEAAKHIGDSIIIIGFVTKVQHVTGRKEAPTLVTIGDKNEIEPLTLLIPGADRQNFTQTPETAYLNQYVQVTGRVLLYKGKTQITLYSEKQISIARDAMLNTPIRSRLRNFWWADPEDFLYFTALDRCNPPERAPFEGVGEASVHYLVKYLVRTS